jgi:quercetin dioxygenase-like cupin family protein
MKTLILALVSISMLATYNHDSKVPSAVYSWDNLEVKKQETRESRQILEGITTHLEYFEMHATTLNAGKMPHSKHTHDIDDELILVREGKLRITTEKTSKVIGPGGIAFILPGEEHGLENAGESEAIYYIVKYRSKTPMDIQRSVAAGGSMIIDRSELTFKAHEKGGRWNYFDRPTAACSDFEMHATKLNARINSHAPHTHVQEEILLMLYGDAIMHIDGKEYKTSAGDVIFMDSMVPHGITNAGDSPCEYFAFQWK